MRCLHYVSRTFGCRFANHERSRKHKENVTLLKQFMEEEEKLEQLKSAPNVATGQHNTSDDPGPSSCSGIDVGSEGEDVDSFEKATDGAFQDVQQSRPACSPTSDDKGDIDEIERLLDSDMATMDLNDPNSGGEFSNGDETPEEVSQNMFRYVMNLFKSHRHFNIRLHLQCSQSNDATNTLVI